jgi:hypothetical protein
MQNTLPPPFGTPEPETNPIFNVVIAYDDFESGKHGRTTYDFLRENLGDDCTFANQMWKFDVLNIPKLREAAVRDALQADLIIIACHGQGDLPEGVKSWLEAWSKQQHNAIALVALFACPAEEAAFTLGTRTYLSEMARRGGVEFFAQPDEWPGHSGSEKSFPFTRQINVGAPAFSALAETGRRDLSFPRWGINE